MKKTFFSLAAFAGIALLALTSCNGKNKKEEPAPQVQDEAAVEQEPVPVFLNAVALYSPGALYKQDKDDEGLMVWNRQINCGTVLEAFSYSGTGVEKKTAVRIVKEERQERSFVHVRYNGDDYWIQDITIALNAKPGVITADDTFIYKKADIKSMSSTALPFGTVVAVAETQDDDKFACISVDTEKETFHEVFVKKDSLGEGDDLTILSLIAAIGEAQNEVLRNELTEALTYYSSASEAVNEKKHEAITKVDQKLDTWIVEESLPGIFLQGEAGEAAADAFADLEEE